MSRAPLNHQSGGIRKGLGLLVLVILAFVAGGVFLNLGNVIFFTSNSGKELTLEEARATANPAPNTPEMLAIAKSLYSEHCASCHGDTGAGDGGEAMMYDPPPSDFTRPAMANIRDGELFYKITEGRKPMPSFRRVLSDTERWILVRLIRTFAAPPAEQKQE